MSSARKKILFVCMGNICRSPLAHAVFEHLAAQRGVADLFAVDSCGTHAYHVGELADPRMRAAAKEHGVRIDHRARHLRPQDLNHFDIIAAADRDNLADIRMLATSEEQLAKVVLLRDFDPDPAGEPDVPDPYYGGARGFEKVFQIVHRSCGMLLDELTQNEPT
jgi:protein-tyrosine phosphatase